MKFQLSARTNAGRRRTGRFARIAVTTTSLALAFAARTAHAHFLWAEIDNAAEPSVHLTLAEGSGEQSGNMLEKIANAEVKDGKGQILTAKADGGSLAAKVTTDVVGVRQNYGVMDKTREGRGLFRLNYFAKAARTVEASSKDEKLPLEFFVRRDGAQFVATLKFDGKPAALAPVKLHEPGVVKPRDLETDEKGEVRFEAKNGGLYGLRGAYVENAKGSFEGKDYDLTRSYTTLTFTVPGPVAPVGTAPAANNKPAALETTAAAAPAEKLSKADPAAYELLKKAHDRRQVLPENFPGFEATLVYTSDERSATGTVRFQRGERLALDIKDVTTDDKDWLEGQLGNFIGHRRGGDFAKGDGRYPLTFGKEADNAYGKLVELNDGMQSSYRVRDNTVVEVTRTAGNTRFTISVVETMTADPGKYLAQHFMVAYRNKDTGDLQKVEGFRDDYTQLDGYWLPSSRVVVTFGKETTPTTQMLQLKNIKILPVTKVAANPAN